MRIGVDGTSLLGPRSGVGNYTGRVLSAMIAANPQWDYLLYSNKSLEPLEPALEPAQRVYSRLPSKRLLWMQLLLPAIIQHSHPHLCHFPNAMAPLWSHRPFVVTIYDASLFLYRRYHPPTRLLSIRLALPAIARRAAAVITVSQHAREELIRVLRLPPDKVHVVYGAAPDHFRPVTDRARLHALRRKYRLPQQFLLYVGTLEPRKNLLRVVRAVHRLRGQGISLPLILVGTAGWQIEALHQEIARLGLENDVRFTGYVPTVDLPGLLSLATLFVFPSLYEGFGLPPLEAMACGAPVLTSDRASLPEICGDAAYFVDPEDEEALSEALRFLISDRDRRRDLSVRGRRRARAFSWEQAAAETAAVYRHVLKTSQS